MDIAVQTSGGVEAAYKAVMKPTEGTILTVARVSADTAMETADSGADCEAVLEATVRSAAEALAQTAQLTDTAEVIFNIYGRQEAGNLLE